MTGKRPGGVWIFFLLLILPENLAAAQGDLDLSFNPPNGFAVFKGPGDRRDRGIEIAIQADGKILVLGYSHNGTNEDILLVRYTPEGKLDPTFNQYGFATYNGGQGDDRGLGLALKRMEKSSRSGNTTTAPIGISWCSAIWTTGPWIRLLPTRGCSFIREPTPVPTWLSGSPFKKTERFW